MNRRKFLKLASIGAFTCSSAGIFAINGCSGPEEHSAEKERDPEWFMAGSPQYMVADAHFHYVDFLQHTEGINALLRAMNVNGVEHIMFSGMPLVKKWDKDEPVAPGNSLDDGASTYWYSATDYFIAETVKTIPAKDRYRFHPYICAFNPTDKYAVDHVQRMLDQYGNLWEGIGEIFGHRDDLTTSAYGEISRANHVALDPVYDLAAQHDLPVSLHNNCTSRAKLESPAYVYEVVDVLKRHPSTRIVWAHAGLSRYLDVDQQKYTDMLGDMLDRYRNLWIDLSWTIFEDFIVEVKPGYGVRPCWVKLVESFPDRFMIGSDAVGRFKRYGFGIRKYYTLLQDLPSASARKVAYDNYISVLPQRVRQKLMDRSIGESVGLIE